MQGWRNVAVGWWGAAARCMVTLLPDGNGMMQQKTLVQGIDNVKVKQLKHLIRGIGRVRYQE